MSKRKISVNLLGIEPWSSCLLRQRSMYDLERHITLSSSHIYIENKVLYKKYKSRRDNEVFTKALDDCRPKALMNIVIQSVVFKAMLD